MLKPIPLHKRIFDLLATLQKPKLINVANKMEMNAVYEYWLAANANNSDKSKINPICSVDVLRAQYKNTAVQKRKSQGSLFNEPIGNKSVSSNQFFLREFGENHLAPPRKTFPIWMNLIF